jgi:hypothetical protein
MYSYFYDEIKPKYGDDVTVCATDTDSLLMEIKTRDVYRNMMDYKRPIMTKIISCVIIVLKSNIRFNSAFLCY